MSESPSRNYLKVCVAKICLNVGWTSIQPTSLELLTDLLQGYISSLAKTAYSYAIHCGNAEANLNHLALAFEDMGVSVQELREYVRYVDSSCALDLPQYPIAKDNHLNLLKPGSREVVTRPFHIHEHLPPMHPHLEDQELLKHSPLDVDNTSEQSTPVCSPKSKVFKRPGEPLSDALVVKRCRYLSEEEGRPLRELSSVMMTTSGFLSPAREGKLPEARTPLAKVSPVEMNLSSASSSDKLDKKKKIKSSSDTKRSDKDHHKSTQEGESDTSKEEDKLKKSIIGKEHHKQKQPKLLPHSKVNVPINLSTIKQKHSSKKVTPNPSMGVSTSMLKKIPKIDKSLTSQIKESQPAPISNNVNSEYKLPVEPDRQKLNIFRKISKVKEDVTEESTEKIDSDLKDLSQVDITIETVIKREMLELSEVESSDVKEEVVDVETFTPTFFPNVPSNTNLPPPVILPSPVLPRPEKKKKRDKSKVKKESSEKYDSETNKSSKHFSDVLTVSKTKMELIEEAHIVPVSFVPTPLPTAPGLIPPTSSSLVPSILGSLSKSESPAPLPSSKPSTPLGLQNSMNLIPALPTTPTYPSTDSNVKVGETPFIKKKEHKKDKKDKLKKKKKNKLKNKDKTEKKKLKLEKKERDKEKLKLKKEKKEKRKEKEVEEASAVNENAGNVPKITLKLGPAAESTPETAENILKKIVIKPVVKKENDPPGIEKPPSPELARFSPLIQPPKHKPKVTITEVTKPSSTEAAPTTSGETSIYQCIRWDSEGNQVWICPACGRQDDGSPMIGCDGCDAWYHWVCVGIQVPPDSSHWYCTICLNKKRCTDSFEKRKKKNKKNGNKKKE